MRYLTEARSDAQVLDRSRFAQRYRGSALVLHTIKGGKLKDRASTGRRPQRNPLAGMTLAHHSVLENVGPEGIHDPQMFQDRRFHREALILLQDAQGRTERNITVGRVGRCDVVVNDYSVSGIHALYTHASRGQSAFFRDKGSRNGTYLNGEKLVAEEDRPIHTGDTLRMGRVEMIYINSRDFYAFLRGEFSNLQLQAAFPKLG